jgi:hypothetical protein
LGLQLFLLAEDFMRMTKFVAMSWQFALLAGIGFCCSGCGGGEEIPDLYTVTGTVTYQGQPVPNADVVFIPDGKPDPKKPAPPRAYGKTDEKGKYELLFLDGEEGAPAGKYKVVVTAYKPYGPDDDTETKPQSLIPEKYSSTASSGITKEVKDKDGNVIDLPLE